MAAPAEDFRPTRMLGLMARSLLLPTERPPGDGVVVEPASGISVTYVGHATVLVRFDGVTLLTDPVYSSLGAVKGDGTYAMQDPQVISGMSAVSVLSVPWVLDKIFPGLSKAAQTKG